MTLHDKILDLYGSTKESLDKDFFNATSCGCWINLIDNGNVKIGSIVEGSIAEFSYLIDHTATLDTFKNVVQRLEAECEEASYWVKHDKDEDT